MKSCKITSIENVNGLNNVCLYKVGGWQSIDSKGKFELGEEVWVIEAGYWIPEDYIPFKVDGISEYNGIRGFKLKPRVIKGVKSNCILSKCELDFQRHCDEPPGDFPINIPKTGSMRVQYMEEFDGLWEMTEKLDGQSVTLFNGRACSRNKEVFEGYVIEEAKRYVIPTGFAVQGELIGPKIQNNPYGLINREFFVFNVWDIENQVYLDHADRYRFCSSHGLNHVPVLGHKHGYTQPDLLSSVLNSAVRMEGIVYKNNEGKSFKVIFDEI